MAPPPLRRLPSLDLLRGFVAVGRRMSITLAAEDLCLTQSAVSRQVRALEQALGLVLLRRGHRAISFTAEGERLFRSADAALQQVQEVVGELSDDQARRPVLLSASIGVTGLWLLPRLARLQARHPGIDLRLSADNRLAALRPEGIDLAIRYAAAATVQADAQRLFGETVAPVLHPSLAGAPWQRPQVLRPLTLLEFEDPPRPWLQWAPWLAARGWQAAKPRAVLRFNQYDQVIQAALAAQGVALGRLELIGDLLAQGRLVLAPAAGPPADSGHAYWLLQASARPRREVQHVAAWLQQEAAQASASSSRSLPQNS